MSSLHSPSTGGRPDKHDPGRTFLRGADVERLPAVETLGAAGGGRRGLAVGRAVARHLAAIVNSNTRVIGSFTTAVAASLVACAASFSACAVAAEVSLAALSCCLLIVVELVLGALHLGVEVGEAVVPPDLRADAGSRVCWPAAAAAPEMQPGAGAGACCTAPARLRGAGPSCRAARQCHRQMLPQPRQRGCERRRTMAAAPNQANRVMPSCLTRSWRRRGNVLTNRK